MSKVMSINHAVKQPINILIVDDNEIDIEAVQRAIKKAYITNPLHKASDGVEALEMLCGQNGRIKLTQPCIILLDINMPRMDGITLLGKLRNHETLKQNIVFMLTTSARNKDLMQTYDLSIAGYIVKENLKELTNILNTYCHINKFPFYEKEITHTS